MSPSATSRRPSAGAPNGSKPSRPFQELRPYYLALHFQRSSRQGRGLETSARRLAEIDVERVETWHSLPNDPTTTDFGSSRFCIR